MTAATHFEVYFDFDNTITAFDVLDQIIQQFSINESWKDAEDEWEAGKIGSKECLERQLAVVRLTASQLQAYLQTIKIDPAFKPILELLRAREIETKIVSDSFTAIIGEILENNNVKGVPILANDLVVQGNRLIPQFPYHNSICSTCANCKTSHLMKRGRPLRSKKIYIGDGRSDVCPAGFCEVIFAKGSLYTHYAPLRPDCFQFHDLQSVYTELKSILK